MTKQTFAKPAKAINDDLNTRSRARRSQLKNSVALQELAYSRRNDLVPGMKLENRPISSLHAPKRNVRRRDSAHEVEVANSIKEFGFSSPAIVTEDGEIIDGVTKVSAAAALGLPEIPCLVVTGHSPAQIKLLRIALNRLSEKGGWDLGELKIEFEELVLADAPVEITGFTLPEVDALTIVDDEAIDPELNDCPDLEPNDQPVTQVGDSWMLGRHRLVCADATKPESYSLLFEEDELARAVFTDPPYNIEINGFAVGKGAVQHREFVAASGEMTDEEFVVFLSDFLKASATRVGDGGVIYVCMDWRHAEHVHRAARAAELTIVTVAVWSKGSGGMGGLYRSAHEFVFVLKKGTKPILNNVELGKHGRDRTNVWVYPGANRRGSSANAELANHPTPKPVELVADAILDVTHRDDIVLDPFLGSGTTIIAAEKTGRTAYGFELDPRYVDVIIRRFETFAQIDAVHRDSGKTFAELQAIRKAIRPSKEKADALNAVDTEPSASAANLDDR
jgi:DNA modification methylase